jgi:hypothetical protein
MPTDPSCPGSVPPAVERALIRVFGWRAAAPVDAYPAISDALMEKQADDAGQRTKENFD